MMNEVGHRARLSWLFDNTRADSIASRLRSRRMAFFRELLASVPPPFHILDIGGTEPFWRQAGFPDAMPGARITLLNMMPQRVTLPSVDAQVGDARDLSALADQSVDFIFSNSVIEHVGGVDDQRQMAREVMRVGRRYFVQTPNRYFPIEPHFVFPLFQFLPTPVGAALIRTTRLGHMARRRSWAEATHAVNGIRLMSRAELAGAFPGCRIYEERVLGLVKSYAAYSM